MRKHSGFGGCANFPLKQGIKTHTKDTECSPIQSGFALPQGGTEKGLFQNALITKAMDEGKTNGQMDTVGQATLPTLLMKQETLKKNFPCKSDQVCIVHSAYIQPNTY